MAKESLREQLLEKSNTIKELRAIYSNTDESEQTFIHINDVQEVLSKHRTVCAQRRQEEMKCSNCDKKAEWLLIDSIPYELLFEPLCNEHFQELREMEGEMNLDFEYIENLSLGDVLKKANEKWRYMQGKYRNLLKLYDELKSEKKKKGDKPK